MAMSREYAWTGTLALGLVMIPVHVVPAASEERVSFRLLHDQDRAPLERRMLCPADGKVVPDAHVIRGFEVAPDQWVTVSNEELESLEPVRSRTIFMRRFVDAASIDPRYYDRPYYLTPIHSDVPYGVLAMALAETGKAGIAEFVMRGRERLAALRSIEGALVLLTLHYEEDMADAEAIAPANAKVSRGRLREMRSGIKALSAPFRPERYRDRYIERVLEYLRRKEEREGVVEAPRPRSKAVDLVTALEESLAREGRR